MRRALALLFTLCACSLRAPRVENTPCSNTAQCDRPAVCFLGECRGHSSKLTVVSAEIRPADSLLGVAQVTGINLLKDGLVRDFPLVTPVSISGSVTQAPDLPGAAPSGLPNTLITFTESTPVIADRVQQILAHTESGGAFSARLPPGAWDVLVNPPPSLPPYRPAQPLDTSAPVPATLLLPRVGSLVPFQAALTADGGVLAGADVTAVDANGNALSAPAAVQSDGGFLLYLPPNTTASSYFLQVGPPPSDVDGGLAAASLAPLPNYDHLPPTTPAVDVPLTSVAALQGTVRDGNGTPISGARVYARSDGMPWSLSRSTTTLSDGSYALSLRAGDYVVEAAPAVSSDGPAVSGEQTKSVPQGGTTLDLICPAKVSGSGRIVNPDGIGVYANVQITATRIADRLLTARIAYSPPTDSTGFWRITADPGLYRVEVVPPADTGLPRKLVQIDLSAPANGEVHLPQITLSPPLTVVGTVCGPANPPVSGATSCDPRKNPPVANATVSFYALDTARHSVLIGSASTDAKGQYKAVLPDVANPGAANSAQ